MLENQNIFKNIVELISFLCPEHPIINCLSKSGYACKKRKYQSIENNGGHIIFSIEMPCILYRGENRIYDSCKAGIYRLMDEERRIIELLKTYHFIDYLKKSESIRYIVKEMKYNIDFWAIAQHYEFSTPIIDVTSEIVTAAFFATHKYDSVIRDYFSIEDGMGAIRCIPYNPYYIYHIGIQPFSRPGKQDGYAVCIGDNDLAKSSKTYIFKQDKDVNLKLKRAILGGIAEYFPDEEISVVARYIHESNIMTNSAIDMLLEDIKNNRCCLNIVVTRDRINNILKNKGMHISDVEIHIPNIVMPHSYSLEERKLIRWLRK